MMRSEIVRELASTVGAVAMIAMTVNRTHIRVKKHASSS